MGDVIRVDFEAFRGEGTNTDQTRNLINVTKLQSSRRSLANGLIQPASVRVAPELAEEHASEPIKSTEDIERISKYLVEKGRYRDNMLFVVGINFGLRVSDLLELRFSHLINEDCTFKTTFPVLEKKTKNTRKVRKNRYITINEAVMEAVTLYLENTGANEVSDEAEKSNYPSSGHRASDSGASDKKRRAVKLDDYMFRSESNRGINENKPMSRVSVDRILKGIAEDVGLSCKVATHTLRKTFGYHQMVMSGNDPRKLLLLQKIFGHSTSTQTLEYIGITVEEIEDAYMHLNLGSKRCYASYGTIEERESENDVS